MTFGGFVNTIGTVVMGTPGSFAFGVPGGGVGGNCTSAEGPS